MTYTCGACQEPIKGIAFIMDRYECFFTGRGHTFSIIRSEAEKVIGITGCVVHQDCKKELRRMRNAAYDLARELLDAES